jgi:hypothetical protein
MGGLVQHPCQDGSFPLYAIFFMLHSDVFEFGTCCILPAPSLGNNCNCNCNLRRCFNVISV